MAKAASKSKAPEMKPTSKKGATKSGTTTRSRKPKKQDHVVEEPPVVEASVIEQPAVPHLVAPVISLADHEAIVEKKDTLLQEALEFIKAKEAELKRLDAQLDQYLKPINNDVQHTKEKVSGLPVFFKWALGIIVLGALLFVGYRVYRNSSDESIHQATQAEVKALEKQRDSLMQDGQFYKRVAEEQAKQTAYYKKKVQEIIGEIQVDNTHSDYEREADKKKINESKNAIRHAASDRELIDVLTNTLRQ